MSMLHELETYYDECGILATRFVCPHKHQCDSGCADFTGPTSAFVSTGYERGDLPRLLFISLDSGSGDKVDENRLPSAVRQQAEIDLQFSKLAKHKHWYRTHELAWYICRRFFPDIKIEETRRFFAHANSAKCCMNKPQRKKANAILFRNCKGYLGGELEILGPQIIVTQGKEAKEAVWSLHPEVINRFDKFASEISIRARRIFWLHTYHPSNWGAFNKQRSFNEKTRTAEGWVKYSELVHAFIVNAQPALEADAAA
jgi:hypothetical protein